MKKNKKIRFCLSCVPTLLILAFSFMGITRPNYSNLNITSKTQPFERITKSVELIQETKIRKTVHIDSIDLQLATYTRKNTNRNKFVFLLNSKPVLTKTVDSSTVKDNAFYRFKDIDLDVQKGDTLEIQWTSDDGSSNNAITAWVKTDITNSKLYQHNLTNGETKRVPGELSMSLNMKEGALHYLSEKYAIISPAVLYILFGLIIIAVTFLMYLLLSQPEEEPQNYNRQPFKKNNKKKGKKK